MKRFRGRGAAAGPGPEGASRDVLFGDAGPSLAVVKRVGELGHHTGNDQQLSTTFSGFDPKAGHGVGRVGLRVGV